MINVDVKISFLEPGGLVPPHKVTRPEQVEYLSKTFLAKGWNPKAPALVGYKIGGYIQLLSGTHRQAAAIKAGLIRIPVVVFSLEDVDAAWGDQERWSKLMHAGDRG